MDAQEVMHMTDNSKITALYSRLAVGDEGGFAPQLRGIEDALDCIVTAIKEAGYKPKDYSLLSVFAPSSSAVLSPAGPAVKDF